MSTTEAKAIKLTSAQARCLAIMGKRQDALMINYGVGFGLNRTSVVKLASLGLAFHEPSKVGLTCRISDAGRTYLAEQKA